MLIGASAGSIEVLLQLLKTLPAEFSGSLFIVQHLAPYFKSELASILNKAGSLNAAFAKDGETVQLGRIYVAPPDHHLLVENDTVHVAKGPKGLVSGHLQGLRPLYFVLRSSLSSFVPSCLRGSKKV